MDITLAPELWEGIPAGARGLVDQWLVKEGARVAEGEAVARVILAMSTLELPAPASGTLERIVVLAGHNFARGQAIGILHPG